MPSRDGAGFFEIDNPDDGSPIEQMISTENRMLIVTQKFTYEMRLADQIDPDRTNPDLPHNVRRELFAHGTHSRLLQQTLLQARVLFKAEVQPNINVNDALNMVVDFVHQLVATQRIADDFAKAEDAAKELVGSRAQQQRSISLPTVGLINETCRSFSQSAHRASLTFKNIIKLFYPDVTNWDALLDVAEGKVGKEDGLFKAAATARPFFKMILDFRDCLEHNAANATLLDFAMEPNGTIVPPTIEFTHRKTRIRRVEIRELMKVICETTPQWFGVLIPSVCARTVQPIAGCSLNVDHLPDDWKASWHTEYCYCMYDQNGRVIPYG